MPGHKTAAGKRKRGESNGEEEEAGGHGPKVLAKLRPSHHEVAVVGSFGGVRPAEDAEFDVYRENERMTVHGQNARIEYHGQADEELMDHYVGLYDTETEELKVMPAYMVHVQRTVKSLQEQDCAPISPSTTLWRERRNALGEAFGTKKVKSAIRSAHANRLDVSLMDGVKDAIVTDVSSAIRNIPSIAEMQTAAEVDRPIPRPNLEAEDASQVYSIDSIISEAELNVIDINPLLNGKSDDLCNYLPYLDSAYSFGRIRSALQSETKDVRRIKLLYYVNLMMAFNAASVMGDRKGVTKRLKYPADILVDGLFSRYTEVSTTRTGDLSQRAIMTSHSKDKLMCYMFALILILDAYRVEIQLLQEDLSLRSTV